MYNNNKLIPHNTSDSMNTYNELKIGPNLTSIIYKRFLSGAYVYLSIYSHIDKPNPNFNTLDNNLSYKIKISYLCSSYNLQSRTYRNTYNCNDRSPKGLPRQLLCEMLQDLIIREKINLNDKISLDANPSYKSENKLVDMYKKMGFVPIGFRGKTFESWKKNSNSNSITDYNNYLNTTETIMITDVQTVLLWCNSYYDKQFMMQSYIVNSPITYRYILYDNNNFIDLSINNKYYYNDIPYNIYISNFVSNYTLPYNNISSFLQNNNSNFQSISSKLPNKLLCNLFLELLADNIINKNDIILHIINNLNNNSLDNYIKSGFTIQNYYNNTVILTSTVKSILKNCQFY